MALVAELKLKCWERKQPTVSHSKTFSLTLVYTLLLFWGKPLVLRVTDVEHLMSSEISNN